MDRKFLRSTLAKESRAYGFTIAFWGSGIMLVKFQGLPSLSEALSYGGGAVIGFGFLTLLAYRRTLALMSYEDHDIMILGMVHYLAALVPMILASYTARLIAPWSFFITGFLTVVTYNLGMLVEESFSHQAERIEKKLLKRFNAEFHSILHRRYNRKAPNQ